MHAQPAVLQQRSMHKPMHKHALISTNAACAASGYMCASRGGRQQVAQLPELFDAPTSGYADRPRGHAPELRLCDGRLDEIIMHSYAVCWMRSASW